MLSDLQEGQILVSGDNQTSRWFLSTGKIKYYSDWLVVYIEQDIADYYKSLVPKSRNVCRQRYNAHITVVREGMEIPHKNQMWGKYEGQEIGFLYSPEVESGGDYYWLNVVSTEIEKLREELGIENIPFKSNPPQGYKKYFHITIGNVKYKNI